MVEEDAEGRLGRQPPGWAGGPHAQPQPLTRSLASRRSPRPCAGATGGNARPPTRRPIRLLHTHTPPEP